jgi:hypothetical protein
MWSGLAALRKSFEGKFSTGRSSISRFRARLDTRIPGLSCPESWDRSGVVDLQDEVEVVRGKEEGDDAHRVAALGPGEGSQDDGIEGGPGPKEEAALERPAGYLDQGA